jgi:outer membrane immunogenic protein
MYSSQKNFAIALAGTLGVFLASQTAKAEDWQGVYVGIAGGYFDSDSKLRDSAKLFPGFKVNSDGGLIGAYLGYNFQIDNIVLGIEVDGYAGFGGETKLTNLPVPSQLKSKLGGTWSVRARAGWAFDTIMPYIAGGYTGMTNKQTFGTGYVGSDDKILSGWTAGGGAEFMVTPGWLIRLDYQYKDFGKRTFFSGLDPNFGGITQKVKANQFTVGGAYKF